MIQANREGEYVGEIVSGKDLGFAKGGRYAWVKCPSCHWERWAQQRDALSPTSRLCKRKCLADFNGSIFKIKPE
jgi:hypothetical protein